MHPEITSAAGRKWALANKHKIKAHRAVMEAVMAGLLVRGPCEGCGFQGKTEGHHNSYVPKNWLKVVWLCVDCHKRRHSRKGVR